MSSQSRDQKRKAKLKKRAERKPSVSRPEPYLGNYWRQKPDSATLMMHTECGISMAWQIAPAEQRMCDQDVVAAMEFLILQQRAGKRLLPTADEAEPTLPFPAGSSVGIIVRSILMRWSLYLEQHKLPARDDVIGVLRSVLGSISKVGTDRPGSTRYLRFVTDWLRNSGLQSVERIKVVQEEDMATPVAAEHEAEHVS